MILNNNHFEFLPLYLLHLGALYCKTVVSMHKTACLVLNPITNYSFGFLFNCTTMGDASESMTALT